MIRQSSASSRPDPLANRKASPFSKQSVARAFRVMAPSIVALTLATAAHAQGTMDFSGATTLIGTFKTFAIYAGAIICFGGLIFAGIRMMSGRFQFLAIDTIHESATNPRRTFDEAKLYELAESIKQHGLIQPITVRPNNSGFEIVAEVPAVSAPHSLPSCFPFPPVSSLSTTPRRLSGSWSSYL
jgi:hypothetical protein